MTHRSIFTLLLVLSTLLLHGCGDTQDDASAKKGKARATLITVATISKQPLEVTQSTVGTLEGLLSPTLSAEVPARVMHIYVDVGDTVKKGQRIASLDAKDYLLQRDEAQAEVARIQALLENQSKIVSRNQALVDQNFISQNAVDNEISQQKVLKQQLSAAKARVASINHKRSKSNIVAPISGIIESKPVNVGDYLGVGDPIVQIVSTSRLHAHLPFPEQLATQLKPGLTVRLQTPTSTQLVETVIRELKPQVSEGSRTVNAIADIRNAKGWQPGATVTGTVVLTTLADAIMVPEQSLVLRPAGKVVYVVRENMAYQQVVTTGVRQNGYVEILSGFAENAVVAVDGAGFLTDKTPVEIAEDDAT